MRFPKLHLFWLVLLCALAMGCGHRATPVPLPPLADIAAITVTIDGVPSEPSMTGSVFDAPDESWASIYAELPQATPDPAPAKWVQLGELRITTKDEKLFHVDLYWTASPPGAFSVSNGKTRGERRCYYRGGDSTRLIAALKAAQQAANGEQLP
jgi:hypothetical protein